MTTPTQPTRPKGLFTTLWIIQATLALGFAWAAFTKLFSSPEELAAMWPWTAAHPTLVKVTGIIDLAAAFGFVLPGLFKTLPKLTLYTAYGTLLLMLVATGFHIIRGEASVIGVNVFFALASAVVIWGRSKRP